MESQLESKKTATLTVNINACPFGDRTLSRSNEASGNQNNKYERNQSMQYSEIEQKLIRLALNSAAHHGEADNAAAMLVKQLRKRGITAEQMLSNNSQSQSNSDYWYNLYRQTQATATILAGEKANLLREIERLKASQNPVRQPRQSRPKYGFGELTSLERDLIFRISLRIGAMDGETIYRAVEKSTDHQIFQRLMKKEFVVKRGRSCYALTAKGIMYVNK